MIGNISNRVSAILQKKSAFIKLARQYPSPFYIFDQKEFDIAIDSFAKTFNSRIPRLQIFYAMKSNPHPLLLMRIVKKGHNIDASSGREVLIALKQKPKTILFTGPAKTADDLQLALKHRDKVILNIDSFTELGRIGRLTKKKKLTIRAGVRIFTAQHGDWSKFGIPLKELKKFWKEAEKYPLVALQGIQIHMSWSMNAKPYVIAIKEISEYLRKHFSQSELETIKFFDIGGGFVPYMMEGVYDKEPNPTRQYRFEATKTLETYADGIAGAIKKHLNPYLNCDIYVEPGRILSTYAMHILLTVNDVKAPNKVIADGGINMVGWEKYEIDYCPVINLTHPALKEMAGTVYGSLCTPDDIWAYRVFAKMIKEGDLLLLPHQGAYTFAYKQEFIKPLPKVVTL